MSEEDKKEYNLKLLEEVGYPQNKEHLYIINPLIFSKMKYLSRVDIEEMFPMNDEFRQAFMTQIYTLLRQDPLIEAETLVRKLTYAFFKSEGDDLIAKQPMQPIQMKREVKSPMGAQIEGKMLSTALSGM